MKLAILNSDPMDCSYGGVAPIMRNMHPYLSRAFDVTYYYIPPSWMKIPGPHRIKILVYLLLHKKDLKKADFILSHIPEGSYVASFTGVPYAHIYHGNGNPMSVSRFRFGKWFSFVYECFFKRISKTASLRYTVGPAWGDVKKLLNPIEHNTSTLPVEERSGFIYAGRLEAPKHIDRLIRIYSQLPNKITDANSFIIAGYGTQEQELKELVSNLNLHQKVIFTGKLDNRDLISKDARCLLFLMASEAEGMPTAIAEALSVGLPVVTTAVGDIPSFIKNGFNGYCVPLDCSDEEFSSRIQEALSVIEVLSANAKDSSSVFKSESITTQLITDILSCTNRLNTSEE